MTKKKQTFVEKWCALLYKSDLPTAAKFVGVTAAGFADWNTGRNVYPGNAELARMTGYTTRTVSRAYDQLEAAGFMKVVFRARPPKPGGKRLRSNRSLTFPTAGQTPTSDTGSLVTTADETTTSDTGSLVTTSDTSSLVNLCPTTSDTVSPHLLRTSGGEGTKSSARPPAPADAGLAGSVEERFVEAFLELGYPQVTEETAGRLAKEVGTTVDKLLGKEIISYINTMLRLTIPEDADFPVCDDDGPMHWVLRRGGSLTCDCPDSPGCRHIAEIKAAS